MPTYTFHNKTTGVVEDVFLKISEKEQYLKDNPDDGLDPGKRMLSELMQDQPEEEDTPEEDKPKGLMAKG